MGVYGSPQLGAYAEIDNYNNRTMILMVTLIVGNRGVTALASGAVNID